MPQPSLGAAQTAAASSQQSVTELPIARLKTATASIDRFLRDVQQRNGVRQGRRISDETFVRRVYLNIAGRIPTFTETESFLSNTHPRRRSQLIDTLLDSDAYPHNAYIFWADILRVKSNIGGGIPSGGQPYVTWLKKALDENRPYDEMVHELISAKGALWEKDNGAVGYYFRDRGMPLDNMANSMRIFLGTRIECAQCHDHPFDKWTQRDFFEMAAFTAGQGNLTRHAIQKIQKDFRKPGNNMRLTETQRQFSRPLLRTLGAGLDNTGNGKIALPRDYQYEDARPGQSVTAQPLFGALPADIAFDTPTNAKAKSKKGKRWDRKGNGPGADARNVLADWMTSRENERFTTVVVNRLWKQVFGRGLIDPVDDMRDDVRASHPQLLAYLETVMKGLNYDMKQFLRVLYNTEAYQHTVVSRDINSADSFFFEGPIMRRMTGEQMWDSLLTLTVPHLDQRRSTRDGAMIQHVYDKYKDYSGTQLLAEIKRLSASTYSDSMRQRNIFRSLRTLFEREVGMPEDFISTLSLEQKSLRKKMAAAQKRKSSGEVARLRRVMADKGLDNYAVFNRRNVRASEVGSPAPAGHFIREFGGSDREQIENGHDQAGVPQILSLLNGYVDNQLLSNHRSVLWRAVEEAPTNNERVNIIYKSLLSREPTRNEMTVTTRDIRARGDLALEDVLWVLVNSREFMFIL